MEIENKETDLDTEFDNAFDELAGGTPSESSSESSDRLRDESGRFASAEGQGDEEPLDEPRDEPEDEPEQLSELAQYQKSNTDWEHRYRSDMGRQSALQKQVADGQDLIKSLQEAAAANKPADIPDEQWETLKAEFPEIAAGIESKFSAMASSHQTAMDGLQGQIKPIQDRAAQQYEASQAEVITRDFPNWQETIKTPEFADWFHSQPQAVQNMYGSDHAADAAYLLKSYASFSNDGAARPDSALRQKRKEQLANSETIGGRNSLRKPAEEDDFDAAFDEFAD